MKKMWMIGMLGVMGVGGAGAVLRAQAAPAAFWTQPNATPAYALTLTYKVYTTPSGATTSNPAVTLSGVTCTGTSPTVSCTAPLGPAAAAAALASGAKSTLSAQDVAGGSAEIMSAPFTPDPSAPTSFKIK